MNARAAMSRQELEAALAGERAYTHALLQALPVAVCTVDADGAVVSLNPEGERLLGWSEAGCAGQLLHDLVHCGGEGHAPDVCPIRHVLDTGKPVWATHAALRCRDGTNKVVEYKCLPLNAHPRLGALFCFRDLSDQLQAEKELLRLASMPEESPNPIVELDPEANIIYANRVMLDLLDRYGFNDAGFPAILPPDMARIVFQSLRTGKGVKGIEATAGEREYEWTFFPIPQLGLLRGYGVDLTERKQAEKELKRARDAALEASRIKSEFLANVSHELRTPLNGILGMTRLVFDGELSPEQQEYLSMVQGSAETLLSVINSILDFSKIETDRLCLKPAAFSLRQHLETSLQPQALRAHHKGLRLYCRIAPEVPDALIGDPARLRQMLDHLVDNAIKFTDHGEVMVEVSLDGGLPEDGDTGTPALPVCGLHIAIRDTGIGIAPENQELIFEPFRQADGSATRAHGGTGLGLAIVAQLVERMHGHFWVESAGPGLGSTFHVTLRVGRQPTMVPAVSLPAAVQGKHVLVVDPHATSRELLGAQLETWGLRPTLVDDMEGALRLLSDTPETPFSLILLDAPKPEVDGVALVARLKSQPAWAHLPVVLITTPEPNDDALTLENLSVAGVLRRPVFPGPLATAVARILVGASAVDGPMPRSGLRILLAEDNAVNQTLAVRLLEKRGHRVVVANNGREALAALARQDFDLILMDIQMPEMDGYATTTAIREQEAQSGRHVPIVAMTAHGTPQDQTRCQDVGMSGFLAKPIDSRALFEVLEQLCPSTSDDPLSGTVVSEEEAVSFDQTALLARVDGDVDLMHELVAIFLEDYPQRLGQMRQALERGEVGSVADAAHTLKGAAGNLCAPGVFEKARELETVAREGDLSRVVTAYEALTQELARLQATLTAVTAL